MTKILIVLESIELGGLKRATTVVGNALATSDDVTYYSISDATPFYELAAPLITAPRPVKITHDAQPLSRYADQMADLAAAINAGGFEKVIVTAGVLTSFIPFLQVHTKNVHYVAWMHNNVQTYENQYYVAMRQEFDDGLRAADAIVALTDSDKAGFLPYNANTVKIWNPLTIEHDAQVADLTRHVIAFTGRIAIQHKGIDYLIELAAKLPADWQIAIAGDALVPADKAEFERLIAAYDVADKIIYRGALRDDALIAHYRASSIFVMTSRWEGLPLVLAEAMSFGLPIVAMWNTGAQEVLNDGEFGVLTPAKDVDALLAGLQPLLEDEAVRRDYSARSLARVADFAMAPIQQQWRQLLHKIDN